MSDNRGKPPRRTWLATHEVGEGVDRFRTLKYNYALNMTDSHIFFVTFGACTKYIAAVTI